MKNIVCNVIVSEARQSLPDTCEIASCLPMTALRFHDFHDSTIHKKKLSNKASEKPVTDIIVSMTVHD